MPEQAEGRRRPAGRTARVVRALLTVAVALVWAMLPVGAATGQEADTYGAPVGGCSITDPRLPEVSGLVTLGGTLLAMNDGGDVIEVYVLDAECAVTDVRRSAAVDPYDPEDLALAADGTLWLADTGDNRQTRTTVALIGLAPAGTTSLTRLTYPDGPHDVEALLLAPDGTPYLVTKEVLGGSSVYRPDAPLTDGATVPVTRVARLGLTLTGTPGGPVGRAGQLLVTGGAVSGDGQRMALRTYTDAYVWPLTGSDVVGALRGSPVRVPLPDAPQGEAIAFAANGRDLLVASEGLPSVVTTVPAQAAVAPAASGGPADPPPAIAGDGVGQTRAVLASVLAGIVATALVIAWTRLRRRG